MKELPILMNGPSVRATLDLSKTMTRRPMKEQPGDRGLRYAHPDTGWEDWHGRPYRSPFGAPGDQLWVREKWRPEFFYDEDIWVKFRGVRYFAGSGTKIVGGIEGFDIDQWSRFKKGKFSPSIHMPRWASRIDLLVKRVWVERVQEISEDNAKAEGVESLDHERYEDDLDFSVCSWCGGTRLYNGIDPISLGVIPDMDCIKCDTYQKRFKYLWISIYGKDSWLKNDWVWACEFEMMSTVERSKADE